MTELWQKLTGKLRRDKIDAELEEEMRTHLAMKTSANDDPAAARRQFGNLTLLLEDSRDAWGWPRPEGWLRDFRYAVHGLSRRPAFTATVVVTLALGIGAGSTDSLTATTGQAPERVPAAYVSPGFFAVLGTVPEVGRTFTPAEERSGGPLAVIISDALWGRRYSADPGVIGRGLILADQTYAVAGVMPATFQYPTPATQVWLPKQATPELLRIREARFYQTTGRLKAGVTMEQAQADLATVEQGLGRQYPKSDAGWSVALEPLKDRLVGKVRLGLWLLVGSVSLLLLIACANVVCLLLARRGGRRPAWDEGVVCGH